MKAFIYRNLRYRDRHVYSVKDTKSGKVVAHIEDLILSRVVFKVSESGRQRVLRERKKYVHAGVVGTPYDVPETFKNSASWDPSYYNRLGRYLEVTYNPYNGPKFILKETGDAIESSPWVIIKGKAIYAWVSYEREYLDMGEL